MMNPDQDDPDDSKLPAIPSSVDHTMVGGIIPSSNHHHAHENDHDFVDDDDEDDWSRRVETDETTTGHLLHEEDSFRHMESVVEGGDDLNNHNNTADDVTDDEPILFVTPVVPHSQRELTMKEKLVMRERERRIETERARLKRQFALNNEHTDDDDDDDNDNNHQEVAVDTNAETAGMETTLAGGEAVGTSERSVTETLGEESIVAHPDEESADQGRLGFNMERFLRNSDSFHPQLEPTAEQKKTSEAPNNVLMKRFLNEPVVTTTTTMTPTAAVAEPVSEHEQSHVNRSVSFDMDGGTTTTAAAGGGSDTQELTPLSLAQQQQQQPRHLTSFGDDDLISTESVTGGTSFRAEGDDMMLMMTNDPLSTTASMDAQDVTNGSDVPPYSPLQQPNTDEPRVLRLTEADMQEMAAIEEASIGNAPPSEREEMLSEIGELADFGGHLMHHHHHHHHDLAPPDLRAGSLDTPTTTMESASQMSGNQSTAVPQSEPRSMYGGVLVRESDHVGYSGAGSANDDTVEANPPSETAREDETPMGEEEDDDDDSIHRSPQQQLDAVARMPPSSSTTNRHASGAFHGRQVSYDGEREDNNTTPQQLVVDGFDFDKNAPSSPLPAHDCDDSYRNLPMDDWSPAGKMGLSPLHVVRSVVVRASNESYGAILAQRGPPHLPSCLVPERNNDTHGNTTNRRGESEPLLSHIPYEIIARHERSSEDRNDEEKAAETVIVEPETPAQRLSLLWKMRAAVSFMVHDVHCEEEKEKEAVNQDCHHYNASSVLQRAFPERFFALLVTLLLEIPVLLMISGGSDSLCALVGRSRYQLLMAFLPLTSAISGNVGLQASTLTTRAISHDHVTSRSYRRWLFMEIGAAFYLALGMGLLLGSIAYFSSGMDVAFGITITVAQCVSIITAGCTGTFAPLLFSFIFKQDSGKWGGPLETAVQDIVGSFAMVILSYQVLVFIGPGPIDPSDVCGVGVSDD